MDDDVLKRSRERLRELVGLRTRLRRLEQELAQDLRQHLDPNQVDRNQYQDLIWQLTEALRT